MAVVGLTLLCSMRLSTLIALTLSTASLWGMPIAPIHAVEQADGTIWVWDDCTFMNEPLVDGDSAR
ncbi:hypothetical protein [Coleofasciculus sp. G1-WW12-02]|uniref:hypothetical protein n=1 Tax=Coleofasciculus sp. G1-WW12-02 TaxID=3068483 RepID=UPI004063F023